MNSSDSAEDRRHRAASLVRGRAGDDLVVLPELWTAGAWAYDRWERDAEGIEGPTAEVMSAAAREADAWLHAGSIVERDTNGTLYNSVLLFDRAGVLRGHYRKIHRYGFDTGEATMMGGGRDIVTVSTDFGVIGLAICYDLRFPELFRGLLDAGAELIVVPAAWPAARLCHWQLLTRTRALEEQVFLLACDAVGTHGGMQQAGHSTVVDAFGGGGDGGLRRRPRRPDPLRASGSARPCPRHRSPPWTPRRVNHRGRGNRGVLAHARNCSDSSPGPGLVPSPTPPGCGCSAPTSTSTSTAPFLRVFLDAYGFPGSTVGDSEAASWPVSRTSASSMPAPDASEARLLAAPRNRVAQAPRRRHQPGLENGS